MFVWKNFILVGQIGAARVDKIDTGQVVFLRNILRPQVFFHRHGIVGAALNGSVIDDNDTLLTIDEANAGDDASGGHVILAVHVVRCKLREF